MERLIEEYLAQRKAEGLSAETIRGYRDRIGKLAAYLRAAGIGAWADVTPKDLDGFLASIAGYAFNTREATVACVRRFLRTLSERGAILSDPSRHVDLPRPAKDDLPLPERPLAEEEVAALLEAMPRKSVIGLRNIAFVEALYSAGLRLSEALALDLRDLDFENGVLRVRRGKGGKARDLPIMRGLQAALRDYLSLRRSLLKGPDEGALFLDQRGKRWRKAPVEQLFNRLNRNFAGRFPRVHAHLFRHSIAVALLRRGADIRYIQAFLGHDSLESTKVYLRLVPVDLRREYDRAMPDVVVEAG